MNQCLPITVLAALACAFGCDDPPRAKQEPSRFSTAAQVEPECRRPLDALCSPCPSYDERVRALIDRATSAGSGSGWTTRCGPYRTLTAQGRHAAGTAYFTEDGAMIGSEVFTPGDDCHPIHYGYVPACTEADDGHSVLPPDLREPNTSKQGTVRPPPQ